MFEKFGELNSFGEINELAENLFNEGGTESLRAMAKENGIQSDFVDMYLQGEIPVLCDQLTAALGKIDVEVAELKPKEIMEDWVEYLRGQCMENELLAFNVRKKGKSLKAYMRRQEALADRMAHTKELPEKEILDRADRLYFHNQHYLYYKKHGCWAHIACSKCGGVTDARWKSGISYESQFQRWTEEPREGHYGTCPMCGARGEYKCQGKVKGTCDRLA